MKRDNSKHETNQSTAPRAIDQAVARAQELVDTRPSGEYSPSWVHEASHVGDLCVLALALRG
jgi:hypothetical protein